MSRSDPRGLSPPWFHILLALADEPKHGYAIMLEVERRTGGEFRLWPATLYTVLKRMVKEKVVEETKAPSAAAAEDARRRFYRLTPRGRALLRSEASRLDGLVRLARQKKVLPAR